jgi:hypothetical protein
MVWQQLNKGRVTVATGKCWSDCRSIAGPIGIEHVLSIFSSMPSRRCQKAATLTFRTALTHPRINGAHARVLSPWIDRGTGRVASSRSYLEKSFFDPFSRPSWPDKDTGLGLSIVARTWRHHGASICLGNRAEGGARAVLQIQHRRERSR